MQQQVPSDNQTRGPTQDPLAIWYSENDGPWVPKVIPAAIPEDGGHLKKRGNRTIVSYGSSYRQPNPSEAGSVPGLICPGCNKGVKTQSELKKHELRHTKPYKCQVAGCTRLEGFSTTNDLDRHMKNEALTKAIKVVLSSSIAREPSNQETTRNILPSGRPSPSNTSDSKSRLAASSNGLTDIVKAGGSQPSNLEIDLSDAQGKVIEAIVKTVRNFGYTLKEHREASSSPPPKILNAGSVAGKKSDKQVICEICKKFKGRPCELNKKFGSKNDWKRHENSQHFQIETWRCDGQRPEGGACSKVCYRKLSFQDHLKKEHKFSDDEEVLSDKVEACRIGRNCQDRFWCGFCIKLVSLRKKGLEAWTERFDHIDDHFMGRNGLIAQGIEDWIPVDGSGKVKETQTTLDASPRSDGSSSGSSSSGSSVDADMEPPPRPAVRPAAKRPRPEETEAPSHKRPRPNEAVIIVCCQCNLQNNPELNESCSNCSTGHTFCENCQTEYRPKEDRSPPHELP
ncbi:hypothetical protein M7I_2138 [Glarea lozoyensis 74030]|uniref:C2H2-type domain-containing protein n=1 Tax=Glarea lozoyensis (strain ATCC 74030 / MF5533) TaxID=1104152 RepID=H0EHZ4_GLAL7|nr:hypothetical protein M7I_2138 [Glarea lozoyensis 74030]